MGEAATWRTIDQLAERCGHYYWIERRLFGLTGVWASAPGPSVPPELRVFCSTLSAERAVLAAQWSDRLPLRAGVDVDGLAVPPAGPLAEALTLLDAQPALADRLSGLVTVVLPRLLASYEEDRARASPVSEAPVMATLELAALWTTRAADRGRALLGGGLAAKNSATVVSPPDHELVRKFGALRGVFPAARPS